MNRNGSIDAIGRKANAPEKYVLGLNLFINLPIDNKTFLPLVKPILGSFQLRLRVVSCI